MSNNYTSQKQPRSSILLENFTTLSLKNLNIVELGHIYSKDIDNHNLSSLNYDLENSRYVLMLDDYSSYGLKDNEIERFINNLPSKYSIVILESMLVNHATKIFNKLDQNRLIEKRGRNSNTHYVLKNTNIGLFTSKNTPTCPLLTSAWIETQNILYPNSTLFAYLPSIYKQNELNAHKILEAINSNLKRNLIFYNE